MSSQGYAQMQNMGNAGNLQQQRSHQQQAQAQPHFQQATASYANVNEHAQSEMDHVESPEEMESGVYEMSDTKRSKREPGGKKIRSCIYCRRSHMVCDTERPCRRCVKRGITHLCVEDSKLAARQLAAQASRAAQKRANGSSGSAASSGSGPTTSGGGATGHKKRRTSSTGAGFLQMSQSKPGQVDERDEGSQGVGSSASWGNTQGFSNYQSTGMPAQQAQDSSSGWAFAPTNINRTDDAGNNIMTEPNLLSVGSDIPSIWPGNDAGMDMTMLNAAGSSSSVPYTSQNIYPAGPSSSSPSTNIQRAEDNNITGRQDTTKYLGVALNNAPRRASAERGGEFGILSEYLESLGIPSLPGGLGDVFTEGAQTQTLNPQSVFGPSRSNTLGSDQLGSTDQPGNGLIGLDALEDYGFDWNALGSPLMGLFNVETNAKRVEAAAAEDVKPLIPEASNTEKFYLAAADQQSGTRDERLKKVIQAKYEAGLLKPYDYARGYARMYKWLEKNVSQASIQAILRPMSVFRPAFRAIAQSLSDLDLIFVEEAFERLMLDYDRVFSAIHTPACLWRRTGEIYKGNKEMSNLTGIPSQCFRGGNLGIFQLMDEESVVKYYQLFGSIAFDTNTKSVNTVCTLHIPSHLTKTLKGDHTVPHTTATASPVLGPAPTHPFNNSTFNSPTSSPPNALGGNPSRLRVQNSSIPGLSLGQSMTGIEQTREAKVIKCALNFTIRRDSWGMPIAIIGNWIPF